jgi:hypothetical protein
MTTDTKRRDHAFIYLPYLIHFVSSFSFFGICIRDSLPPALQTKALSSPTKTKRKEKDNA